MQTDDELNETGNNLDINQKDTSSNKNDEISLIDLFAVLLKHKWMIFIITMIAAVFIVVYSIISLKLPADKSFLPNEYTVTANMLIKDSSNSNASSISGAASAAASLMGINLNGGGTSVSSLVVYLTSSNPFYDAIAQHFDLYTKYDFKKSPIANTRNVLKKVVFTNYDDGGGVEFSLFLVKILTLNLQSKLLIMVLIGFQIVLKNFVLIQISSRKKILKKILIFHGMKFLDLQKS